VEGSELSKTRPAVVISSDAIRSLPIRLIAPITGWKSYFSGNLWHVRVEPNDQNGLSKESAVDAMQIRGVDVSRFQHQMGRISAINLEQIAIAIAAVIEAE
jgi:mRNA interferase MazF